LVAVLHWVHSPCGNPAQELPARLGPIWSFFVSPYLYERSSDSLDLEKGFPIFYNFPYSKKGSICLFILAGASAQQDYGSEFARSNWES
jgi:hypothetical protein